MPARFQSGWTLAFMKILLVVFDFALWVWYIYYLRMFIQFLVIAFYLLSRYLGVRF